MYVCKIEFIEYVFFTRITNHFSLTFAASITPPAPPSLLLCISLLPPSVCPLYSLLRFLAKMKLARRSLLLDINRQDQELFKIQNLPCFVNPRKVHHTKVLQEGGGECPPHRFCPTKVDR